MAIQAETKQDKVMDVEQIKSDYDDEQARLVEDDNQLMFEEKTKVNGDAQLNDKAETNEDAHLGAESKAKTESLDEAKIKAEAKVKAEAEDKAKI